MIRRSVPHAIPRVKPGCVALVRFGRDEYRLTPGELSQYRAAVARGYFYGSEKAAPDAENAYRAYCLQHQRPFILLRYTRRRALLYIDLNCAYLIIPTPEVWELIRWCDAHSLNHYVDRVALCIQNVPRADAIHLLDDLLSQVFARTVPWVEGEPVVSRRGCMHA